MEADTTYEANAYGVTYQELLLYLVVIALGLYLMLRGRMPWWLLGPVTVVLAPLGAFLTGLVKILFYTILFG